MDNQGGQPPREDGTATRPRAGDKITPESTMEETVRSTSPPQIAGSHAQNNERERAEKTDNKAAQKQPPRGGDNERHVHSAMAIGQDNIVADGLSRHKDRSEGEGITGSGTDTESHTMPGVDRATINQPSSDDGWGRVRPNVANLAEPTTPDVENAASSLPHRDDDWRRRRPKYAGLGDDNTEADRLSRHPQGGVMYRAYQSVQYNMSAMAGYE